MINFLLTIGNRKLHNLWGSPDSMMNLNIKEKCPENIVRL